MKALNIILAIIVVGVIAFTVWPDPPKEAGNVSYDGASITVSGTGNTLESIALALAQAGEGDVLSYDPEARRAICYANLIVKGELQIGDLDGPPTTFEFHTQVCGDKKLMVSREGKLSIYNTEVATRDRIVTDGICPTGYSTFIDGMIVARDAQFRFMSGSFSKFLQNNATADIGRCIFEGGDTASFTTYNLDGKNVRISDCKLRGDGNYGLVAEGDSENPVVLRNCQLTGRVAAVHNNGDADIVLLDCTFPRGMLEFAQSTGTVRVKHTIRFNVLDASGNPVQGVRVTAASMPGLPIDEADGTGTGRGYSLELTEYVARRGAPVRKDGVNNATPHRIVVYSAAGEVIARREGLDVAEIARMGMPVVITLE